MTDNFVVGSRKRIVWSHEDKVFLKENFHLLPLEEIAEKLNKSIKQIKNQASRQYLTRRIRKGRSNA